MRSRCLSGNLQIHVHLKTSSSFVTIDDKNYQLKKHEACLINPKSGFSRRAYKAMKTFRTLTLNYGAAQIKDFIFSFHCIVKNSITHCVWPTLHHREFLQ